MKMLTAAFAALSMTSALARSQDVQSLEHVRFATAHSSDPAAMVKQVQTDLNSAPAALAAKYGKPVKVESAWCFKGTSYSFQPSLNTYIFATTNPEGTAIEDLMYFKFNGPFSEAEKSVLYKQNVDQGRVWDGDYRRYSSRFDWDGKQEFKKLGLENYKHYVQYETNGVNAIVENMHEQDGKTSYQLRTLKQFFFEQTAIKRLIKEEKAKGTVTVGAIERVR
jgi:hypothetical protein